MTQAGGGGAASMARYATGGAIRPGLCQAGGTTGPAEMPPGTAAPARTAPASGSLNGQPAFVTAGRAVDSASPAARSGSSPTAGSGTAMSAATGSGGTALRAGNPNGRATVPAAGLAVDTSHPSHVIGDGSPAAGRSR